MRVAGVAGDFGWHILDSHAQRDLDDVVLTVLCVHGNPTSSFFFRRVLAAARPGIRVIAVDQLGMGWSQRTPRRRLADRIDDLDDLIRALDVRGPVVTAAHDWGGPISLGWALRHLSGQTPVVGVVLMNTAVHQPAGSSAPWLIRAARLPLVRWLVSQGTPGFIRGTLALSPQLPAAARRGYLDPYPNPRSRAAIGDFIADIPLSRRHPSRQALDAIAEGIITGLREVPILLLWGPRDPVFSDRYLHDLVKRLPHADVHRYPQARHLVLEDAPEAVEDLMAWLDERILGSASSVPRPDPHGVSVDLGQMIRDRAERTPQGTALREVRAADARGDRLITWSALAARVGSAAQELHRRGVQRGDRVAILVPPGIDAVCAVYACWQVGAVVVVIDRGLGIAGMRRALRGVGIDHAWGTRAGRLLARSIGVRSRFPVDALPENAETGPAAAHDGSAPAAIVFTSGSTGPAKGVRYTREQIRGTCNTLIAAYDLDDADVLVAAFAPWAILGPALGLASVIPAMDLLRPSTLTAAALAEAVDRGAGTVLWASPAALRSVVDTAGRLDLDGRQGLTRLRLVLAAGAPVSSTLLEQMASLVPNARLGTPYGMTEVLPVTAVWLDDLQSSGPGPGVLVGRPVPGVEVAIDPIDANGLMGGESSGVVGEILVRAAHMRDGYHHLWGTQRRASRPAGWHRTGDVGVIDAQGRLWLGGRLAHVIWTPDGPVLPVEVEQRVETVSWVRAAAAVGVGPPGTQALVVVIIEAGEQRRHVPPRVALERIREVRACAQAPVAAVLRRASFPLDVRHQAKIDRTALADWAGRVLAGG